jgi:hypothetical protein
MSTGKAIMLFCILMLLCGSAFGQTVTSNLLGTIIDPQQAVIPGAEVQVTDQTLGLVRTTITTAEGIFRFNNLQPGTYTVAIKVPGFKGYLQKDIALTASETRDLGRVTLELGTLQEEVTVTAEPTPVQVASSEKSGTIDTTQLTKVPIKSRDIFMYLTMIPGTTSDRNNETADAGALLGVIINGQKSKNFTVDGVTDMDGGADNRLHFEPNVDSISEIKVLGSNYAAEYGRNAGGTITVITKGGGRKFTGTGWNYFRNEAMNANSWDNNRTKTAKSRYRYDIYGYSVGGPVYIPKVFNTEKKYLFLFVSQEFTWAYQQASVGYTNVPTDAERIGDFSQSTGQAGKLIVIKDPTTGQPFDGNKIPSSLITPVGQSILNFFPKQNYVEPDLTLRYQRNYIGVGEGRHIKRNDMIRIDTSLTSKLSGYFRYGQDEDDAYSYGGGGPGGPAAALKLLDVTDNTWKLAGNLGHNPGHGYAMGVTYVINQTMVNEALFGKNYTVFRVINPYQGQFDRSKADAPKWFKQSDYTYDNLNLSYQVPTVSFGSPPYNSPSISPPGPTMQYNDVWSGQDNLTKIIGKHNLKAGIYIERNGEFGTRGSTAYNGSYSFDPSGQGWLTNLGNTGNGFANALLGNFNKYSEAKKVLGDFWFTSVEFYVQDNWRVFPRLTLDLGVRFYHTAPQFDESGQNSAFVPSTYDKSKAPHIYYPFRDSTGNYAWDVTGDPNKLNLKPTPLIGTLIPGSGDFNDGLQVGGKGVLPSSMYTWPALKPGFRIGFAWDVFGNGKTAIRGGYGGFYDRGMGTYAMGMTGQSPIVRTSTMFYSSFNNITSGGGGYVTPASVFSLIGKHPLAKTQNLSLGIQQDLGFGTVLDISYVGTFGRNVPQAREINPIPMWSIYDNPSLSGFTNLLRSNYPGLGNLLMGEYTGINNYNSLQASVNRRFSNNLALGVAYTFAKNLGNINASTNPTFLSPGASTGLSPYQSQQPDLDYAYGSLALVHNLVIHYVYDLPKLGTRLGSKVLGAITDNWVLSGTITIQSGSPYTPSFRITDPSVVMTGSDSTISPRFNVVGNPVLPKSERTYGRQFNTNAFQLPTPCSATNHTLACFGNAGVGILYGPGKQNWDMSLAKRIPVGLGENRALQFRAEAYNIWNHVNFSSVTSAATFSSLTGSPNADFGQLSRPGSPRVLQLSLRFEY